MARDPEAGAFGPLSWLWFLAAGLGMPLAALSLLLVPPGCPTPPRGRPVGRRNGPGGGSPAFEPVKGLFRACPGPARGKGAGTTPRSATGRAFPAAAFPALLRCKRSVLLAGLVLTLAGCAGPFSHDLAPGRPHRAERSIP